MKVTLAVVTCNQDLLLLRRLVNSIYQHWYHDDVQEIVVVYNDTDFNTAASWINNLAQEGIKLRVIDCHNMWPTQTQHDWHSQQQLKLLISEYISTDWYIIHDSKDYYIASAGSERFFTAWGTSLHHSAKLNADSWAGHHAIFETQYRNAYALMDLPMPGKILRAYPSVFPAHTQTILDLLEYLKIQTGKLFDNLLLLEKKHKQLYTEYSLISAWHTKQNIMDDLYLPGRMNNTFYDIIKSDKTLRTDLELSLLVKENK